MPNELRILKHGTVLMLDEALDILDLLAEALASRYEVLTGGDAESALEHARRGASDPSPNGLTILAASDSDTRLGAGERALAFPMVLVTGRRDPESPKRAFEASRFRQILQAGELRQLRAAVDRAWRRTSSRELNPALARSIGSSRFEARHAGQNDFGRVIERIWIAYQPILAASDRALYGYEALMRNPDPAFSTPDDLLEAASRRDHLRLLGQVVRARAAAPIQSLAAETALFINLHPRDLFDPELMDPRSALGSRAAQVVLEITERASLGLVDGVRARVAALREIGFRIALDDVGADCMGASNFALLQPEFAKLDVSLVRNVDESPLKQKLVASVTAFCRDTGRLTVAEGVGTTSERDALVDLGCDLLQGNLFARPGPAFPEPRW